LSRDARQGKVWIIAVASAVLAAIVVAASGQYDYGAAASPDYPADVRERLGVTPATEAKHIPREEALLAAAKVVPWVGDGASVDAYLVFVEDRALEPELLGDRPIWLVRYAGFELPLPRPITSDRTPAEAGSVNLAYVFVDAATGEWLLTRVDGDATH
jgi:hypothetical protein